MQKIKYLQYVNALIGTKNIPSFSHGNIYPLAQRPNSMAAFSVQTNDNARWFYDPVEKRFEGIRLSHMPSPWVGDYGHVLFSFCASELPDCVKSAISITPAKISGNLPEADFVIVPTETCAILKIRFKTDKRELRICGYAENDLILACRDGEINGFTTACDHESDMPVKEYLHIKSCNAFDFVKKDCYKMCFAESDVEIRMGISFVSAEQARVNFGRELKDKSIDDAERESERIWESKLSKVRIAASEEVKKTFYSCIYRAYIFPRKFSEADSCGEQIHLNFKTGKLDKGVIYVDNGFWDTYRTLYPFLSLVESDYPRMIEGFYNFYRETGWLPRWLAPDELGIMPGTLIEAVAADAEVKGLVPEHIRKPLFEALLHNAETASDNQKHGRKAVKEYRRLGYVPNSVHESVNETLDNVYGDYCIAQYADSIGEKEYAEKFRKYSENYKNLFDSAVGFMRAKDENGNFAGEFDEFAWGGDYTEGSAWHSSFAVCHDMAGLNELYSGNLSNKIDILFDIEPIFHKGWYGVQIHEMTEMAALEEFGQCAINNEPSFHIPYIYAELGDAKKSAQIVHRMLDKVFGSDETGFPGDEDNGAMATWVIFSMLGLYPFCPGRADYLMTEPYVESYEIDLLNGKTVKFDKKDFGGKRNKITYEEIMNG